VAHLETCWTPSDIFNGLMALPNLVARLVLSPLVAAEMRAIAIARSNAKAQGHNVEL